MILLGGYRVGAIKPMGPAIEMTSAKVFANDNGVAGPDLGGGNVFLQGLNFLTSRVKWHTEFEK